MPFAALALALAPLQQAALQSPFAAGGPRAVNLERDAVRFEPGATASAFLAEEYPSHADFNGDGDDFDWVLHVVDGGGHVTNLGIACELALATVGPWTAFLVDEQANGAHDANGDGDTDDWVLHVYDAARERVTNLGVAVWTFELGESLLAYDVSEAHQGGLDRNGDGDTHDSVLEVVMLPGLQRFAPGLATGSFYQVRGELVAFGAVEAAQGGTDLNGDGDGSDHVLHLAKPRSGGLWNLERAVPFSKGYVLAPPYLGYRVDEQAQAKDLNGDGDQHDFVFEALDIAHGTTAEYGLACDAFRLDGEAVALRVQEAELNLDLNGDGDAADRVLFAGLLGEAPLRNLELAVREAFDVAGPNAVALVEEADQGVDLNADGDLADSVAHVRDLRRGPSRNLGLACAAGFVVHGDLLALRVHELAQGGLDLNGNGLTDDAVLHLHDLVKHTTENTGHTVWIADGTNPDWAFTGRSMALILSEARDGCDFNGDGDELDTAVHVLDLPTGRLTNLGLASPVSGVPGSVIASGGTLLFRVSETAQGGADLNGDGDTGDDVLHAVLALPE